MTDTINRQDIPRLDQKFELFHTPDGTVIGRKGSDLYETPITAQHFRTIIDAIDGKRDIESIYQLLADQCPRDTLDLFFKECQVVFHTTVTRSDLAKHARVEPRAHPPKSVSSFSIAILGNLLGQSIHDQFATAEWARCISYSIDSFQSCLSEDFLAFEASSTIRPAYQRAEIQPPLHRDFEYEQLEKVTSTQLLSICARHNLLICALEAVPYRGILDVNQACLQSGVPCVFVVVNAASFLVGPTLIPSRTACFECGQLALFSEEHDVLDPVIIEHFTAFSLDRRVFSAKSIELASSMVYTEVENILGIASASRFSFLDSMTEVPCDNEETTRTTIFPFFRSKCSQCSTSLLALRPQSYTSRLMAEISSAIALTTASVSAKSSNVPDGPRTVGIVGGGTAGYFTALALRAKLPHLQVTMIDSSTIPSIEVGEATTPPIVEFLHRYLGFQYQEFYEKVQPTWKLGIQFSWGLPGDYHFDFPFGDYSFLEEAFLSDNDINSMSLQSLMMGANRGLVLEFDGDSDHRAVFDVMAGAYAYHLDNKKLVAFLKEKAHEAGVEHIDAVISDVALSEDHEQVACLITSDTETLKFDLYVDCSGFRSLLLEKALGSRFVSYEKSLFADTAIVANVPHVGSIRPYTSAESMDNGWCWNIPQRTDDHRGYVFSSSFCTLEEAVGEMRSQNPHMGDHRTVRFRSGRHEEFWKGNVVGIGNAYGFVEPLQSTALHMVIEEIHMLIDNFPLSSDTPQMRKVVNRQINAQWDYLRWFLAIHYKFNKKTRQTFGVSVTAMLIFLVWRK